MERHQRLPYLNKQHLEHEEEHENSYEQKKFLTMESEMRVGEENNQRQSLRQIVNVSDLQSRLQGKMSELAILTKNSEVIGDGDKMKI